MLPILIVEVVVQTTHLCQSLSDYTLKIGDLHSVCNL